MLFIIGRIGYKEKEKYLEGTEFGPKWEGPYFDNASRYNFDQVTSLINDLRNEVSQRKKYKYSIYEVKKVESLVKTNF